MNLFDINFSSIYIDWNVLSKLVSIVEDNYDVDLEFNLKLSVLYGRTREYFREQLIERYLNVIDTITISHLNILNFGSLCLCFESFNSYQLDLKRFYLKFRMTFHNMSFERFSKSTVSTIDLSIELKFRNCFSGGGF
jgi:hypothetical protein